MPKVSGKTNYRAFASRAASTRAGQSVTDELFAGNESCDSRGMAQVKYEMLRRAEKDGHSISDGVMRFGFSRQIFIQAQVGFEAGGVAGLVRHKRGPK
jgi:hypothetical protein